MSILPMRARSATVFDAVTSRPELPHGLRPEVREATSGRYAYRKLLVRQNVQLAQQGLTGCIDGVTAWFTTSRRLHKVGYFKELMETNHGYQPRAEAACVAICRETTRADRARPRVH